jgi:hypothetical protein
VPFYVSKPRPHTHQACRSLLQKAVRRGHVELTRQTACHLLGVGDASWLRQRTAVIVFEECWPLAADLDWGADRRMLVERLARVAQAEKVKDATGLGSLAHALVSNDHATVLSGSAPDRHIERVADAIRHPVDFWNWTSQRATGERVCVLVEAARHAHRRGGWPWDQAFIVAAAYLAVTGGVPHVHLAAPQTEEFPYWVALDRHTPQGKVALRAIAKQEDTSLRHLLWASFYFEGALTNAARASVWWSREVAWRLKLVGLDEAAAWNLWQRVRPIVAAELREEAEALRNHVNSCT